MMFSWIGAAENVVGSHIYVALVQVYRRYGLNCRIRDGKAHTEEESY